MYYSLNHLIESATNIFSEHDIYYSYLYSERWRVQCDIKEHHYEDIFPSLSNQLYKEWGA